MFIFTYVRLSSEPFALGREQVRGEMTGESRRREERRAASAR